MGDLRSITPPSRATDLTLQGQQAVLVDSHKPERRSQMT
jgi:hypothetical protein